MSGALVCGACGAPVAPQDWNRPGGLPCANCQNPVEAWVFPAAWASSEGLPAPRLDAGEGAACYFHPANQAEVACTRCGRLVCRICSAGSSEGEICRDCFDRATRDADPEYVPRAIMHDGVSLVLAAAPVATIFMPLFSAPLAILYTLFTWRRTHSAVPRGGIRRWLAILIAVLSLAWFIAAAYWISLMMPTGRKD